MKLGMNNMRARGYKVTEQILNICINYANWVWSQGRQNTAEVF